MPRRGRRLASDSPESSSHEEDLTEDEVDDPNNTQNVNLNNTIFQNVEFSDGSIKRIDFFQFLTYDQAVCFPGPHMNVIVGANGVGKSTIICGICLAVGGSPKILGRSERFGDYIKHGCREGSVQLTIADSNLHGCEITFKAILKLPNTIEYYVNKRKTSRENLRSMVVDYNIQIDNPCTFLAQDKVKSFSAQNPQELLLNTEKAGLTELYELHQNVIEKKGEEANHEYKLRALDSQLEAIRNELAVLKPLVESFNKKQKMRTRMGALEKKRAILYYDEAKTKFESVNEAVRALKKTAITFENDLKKLDGQMGVDKESQRAAQRELIVLKNEMSQLFEQISKVNKPNFYNEKIENALEQYTRAKTDAQHWGKRLTQYQTECENAKHTFQDQQTAVKDAEVRRANLLKYLKKISDDSDNLQVERRNLAEDRRRAEAEVRHAESSEETNRNLRVSRLYCLPGAGKPQEAYRYFQENAKEFNNKVYIPLLDLVCSGPNPQLTVRHLVHVLGMRDLCVFVFGCKADEMKLTSKFPGINSTVITDEMVESSRSQLVAPFPDELKSLGFECRLIDRLQGPDHIRTCCVKFGLNNVLIGGSQIDTLYADIGEKLKITPFKLYLTNQNRIQVRKSRYRDSVICNAQPLRNDESNRRLEPLTKAYSVVDRSKIDRCKAVNAECLRKLKEVDQKEATLTEARIKCKTDIQEVNNHRARVEAARQQFEFKKTRLENHKTSKPDLAAAQKAYMEVGQIVTRQTLDNVATLLELREKLMALEVKRELVRRIDSDLEGAILRTGQDRHAKNDQLRMCIADLEAQKEAIENEENAYRNARRQLRQLCELSTTNVAKMSDEEKEKLKALEEFFGEENVPSDMDLLMRDLAEEEAKLQIVRGAGTIEDVKRYEECDSKQDELQAKRSDVKEQRDNYDQRLGEMVDRWLTPLSELVDKISENFSRFFASLGCTGEVKLDRPENKLDVEKYGIEILVRFRETERLRRLDHQTQSGGERSVSTMLYLLALQELCPVPFRCVDEINQGMDPTNEKKVFELMVDTLSAGGNLSKTQYFLLTPKLLRGLKFSDKVTVQIVHNSPTMPENSSEWDHTQFLNLL